MQKVYWRVTPEEGKGGGSRIGQSELPDFDDDLTVSLPIQEGTPEQRSPLTESHTGETRAFVALPCSVLGKGLPYQGHDLGLKADVLIVSQTHSLQLSSKPFLEA